MTDALRLAERFRAQAETAIQRGSPLYVELLRRLADDLLAGGPSLAVLGRRAGERRGQALPLRFMAAAHRLALAGGAPELAAHYPSTGGDGDVDGAWAALLELVRSRAGDLDALLDEPLQTNEPGRSRALVTGFLTVAAATGLPLRLCELGASAGLNLNWTRYRFDCNAGVVGDPDSPLRYTCAWDGAIPPVEVVEARGCDQQPLDAESDATRLTLRSAVWPDQPERLAQLDAALAIARTHPPAVDRADALDWVERVEPRRGSATVVFHSVFEQYLDPAGRERLAERMAQLLTGAAADAPVAWLSLERPSDGDLSGLAEVRLAMSPDPHRRRLGRASYHGSPLQP